MLRSDAESSSLKTYLPAGKILPPGISTGWLNVTRVFLSHSSAITLSRSAGATRDEQKIIATTVNRFIFDDTQESETTGRQPDLLCALSMEAPALTVLFKTAQSNRRPGRAGCSTFPICVAIPVKRQRG